MKISGELLLKELERNLNMGFNIQSGYLPKDI